MVSKEDLERSKVGMEPVIEKPLVFATDADINILLNEMDDEKQPFERSVQREDPDLFEIEEKVISPSQKHRVNQTSEFVVTYIDKSLAAAMAVWAKSADTSQFEADPKDIDELAKYWGVYFQDKDITLPPWVMAVIISVIVLSKKFNLATHVRKLNIELMEEKELTRSLNEQIAKLTKERELGKLKDEVDKLKGEKKNEQGS